MRREPADRERGLLGALADAAVLLAIGGGVLLTLAFLGYILVLAFEVAGDIF